MTHALAALTRLRADHLAEQALANALHLTGTIALRARDRLGSGTGAGAFAVVARECRAHVHRQRGAEHRLFERDVGHHFEVLAARRTRRSALTAERITAEERIEDVAEPTAGEEVTRRATSATHTGLTETVVARAGLRIGQHFVRLGHLLELLLG